MLHSAFAKKKQPVALRIVPQQRYHKSTHGEVLQASKEHLRLQASKEHLRLQPQQFMPPHHRIALVILPVFISSRLTFFPSPIA